MVLGSVSSQKIVRPLTTLLVDANSVSASCFDVTWPLACFFRAYASDSWLTALVS